MPNKTADRLRLIPGAVAIIAFITFIVMTATGSCGFSIERTHPPGGQPTLAQLLDTGGDVAQVGGPWVLVIHEGRIHHCLREEGTCPESFKWP